MDNETESYSAGTSFGDFVADSLSGAPLLADAFESPAEPAARDAAGAPPAEPADPAQPSPTTPDGTPAAAAPPPDGTTPAEPSPADPDTNPFEAAAPLTYTVNGQQRTFDGIAYVPGVGAVIQDADIAKLQQRLSERDHLYERSLSTNQRVQELERLMTWQETVNGERKTITGPDALEAQQVRLGRTLAALQTLANGLDDPETFASLVTLDDQNRIILNQSALSHLLTRSELAQVKAEGIVRSHWASAKPQPSASAPAGTTPAPDAPTIAAHFAQQWGGGVLTKADTDFLAGQVPRYIRPATAEDAAQDLTIKAGDPVLDPAFEVLVKDRAELRKGTAAAVSTASTVAKENGVKLAAALLPNGKAAPVSNQPPRPAVRPAPTPDPTQDAQHAHFRKMEQAAFAAM